jgi:RNA polymerase sigma-70 factor (ECF subfamily)
MADLRLVRAAQRGDPFALSRLLDDLAPWVGRICAAIALDQGADAAQETLLQVFRDLRALRDPELLSPWVRRIAVREAVRHAERARREPASSVPAESLPAPDSASLRSDVRRVLEALRPEQRAILVLRDLEGLSEREAAEQLSLARGTAKSRLSRARTAFAERWNR